MRVLTGSRAALPAGLYARIAGYRHRVFIERLGWQLASRDNREQDQFDRQDTVYVVAQDDTDSILGCARLLPTTDAYLLGTVFPELLNGALPPCDPRVWELSRFACAEPGRRSGFKTLVDFPTSDTARLMREVMLCAQRHGAERLITVTWVGIERLLRRLGIRVSRAGPAVVHDGQHIVACWIELECRSRLASSPFRQLALHGE